MSRRLSWRFSVDIDTAFSVWSILGGVVVALSGTASLLVSLVDSQSRTDGGDCRRQDDDDETDWLTVVIDDEGSRCRNRFVPIGAHPWLACKYNEKRMAIFIILMAMESTK